MFNLSIRKGSYTFAEDYISVSGGYEREEEVDSMRPILPGKSTRELLEFSDANSNNLLDDGDYFVVSIPPTQSKHKIETYLILLDEDFGGKGILGGINCVVNWYKGIFGIEKEDSSIDPTVFLRFISEEESDGARDSTLEVSRVMGESKPFDHYWLELSREDTYETYKAGLQEGMIIIRRGNLTFELSIEVSDINANDLFDVGDQIRLMGLDNHSKYTLRLNSTKYNSISSSTWITGIGPVVAHIPLIKFGSVLNIEPPEENLYKIKIEEMVGIPSLSIEDAYMYVSLSGTALSSQPHRR